MYIFKTALNLVCLVKRLEFKIIKKMTVISVWFGKYGLLICDVVQHSALYLWH